MSLPAEPPNRLNPSNSCCNRVSGHYGVQAARETVTTPAAPIAGAFVSYTFTTPANLAAGDWFYVGAYEPFGGSISIGIDAAGGASSWASSTGDTLPGINFGDFASLGLNKDLMIRAVGIPEPASALLVGCGLLGLALRRRR